MAVSSPRADKRSYQTVPPDWADEAEHRRKLAYAVNSLREGKINATGSVTLSAGTTTTVLSDANINPSSCIPLSPLTANAAAAIGTTYFSAQGSETATITHANNAQTDRTFRYAVLG